MSLLEKNKCNIQCEWMESQRALVNPDGQVWPCCYIANMTYTTSKTDISRDNNFKLAVKKKFVLNNYYENIEKYNIFENDMKSILDGEWFTKTLPESWNDSDSVLSQCVNFCSVK